MNIKVARLVVYLVVSIFAAAIAGYGSQASPKKRPAPPPRLAIVNLSCTQDGTGVFVVVQGEVVNANTLQPVVGANVRIRSQDRGDSLNGTTDSQGRFVRNDHVGIQIPAQWGWNTTLEIAATKTEWRAIATTLTCGE